MLAWTMRGVLLISLGFCNLSCSVNILETFADKTSNEALYVSAQKKVDAGDFTGALQDIATMKGAYAQSASVLELKASAYAGRCGLNFLDFATDLKDIGTNRFFPFLLRSFRGSTTSHIDDCLSAETTIRTIGEAAALDDDQNIFLALVAFAKIGTVLAHYADSDNNGTVTATYDPCVAGGGDREVGPLDESDVRQVGTGITLALASIDALSGSVDLGVDVVTDISGVCDALSGPLAGYNFCAVTDAADFTADHLKGIRSLIKESDVVGLGANCTGDISACNCP